MKIPFVLSLLFLTTGAFCQSMGRPHIRELRKAISNAKSIEQQINLSHRLSETYRDYNLDSAYYYANESLRLSKTNKLVYREAESYYDIAYVYSKKDYARADSVNQKSLAINKQLGNKKGLAFNYLLLGRIAQQQADYVNASRNYFYSLKLAGEANDDLTKILNYQNLAFLFLDQQDFKKALDYAFMANKMTHERHHDTEIGVCAGIIAEIYRTQGKQELAEKYFKYAYDFNEKNKHEFGMAWVLTNWSLLYDGDNMVKGLEMELRAQEIWDAIASENTMSIANLYNIGYAYMEIGDTDVSAIRSKLGLTQAQTLQKARYFANKSLAIAKNNNNAHWIMYNIRTLASIDYREADIENFSKNLLRYYEIKDSLYSQENKNQIAALESKQELDAKDKQIQLNKITLQSKEKEKWLYISGIAFLLIIAGLILIQSRSRKKTNKKLQILNNELDSANKVKARFFSILNHDLRSPVSSLISFLHLQKNSPELLDEESKKRMENKTISSAENLLDSMEDILLWSKGQMEHFEPHLQNITVNSIFTDLEKHFSNIEKVRILFEDPENLELFTDENYLKTILRNLIGNAIKALEKIPDAQIVLKAFTENGQSCISIGDNGPGGNMEKFRALYDEKEVVGIKTGLGLHLIRDLAKAINCKITVDSKTNLGTTFTISFK